MILIVSNMLQLVLSSFVSDLYITWLLDLNWLQFSINCQDLVEIAWIVSFYIRFSVIKKKKGK